MTEKQERLCLQHLPLADPAPARSRRAGGSGVGERKGSACPFLLLSQTATGAKPVAAWAVFMDRQTGVRLRTHWVTAACIGYASGFAAGVALEELDLGVDVHAVTRATPGLGRGLRPPHLRKEGRKRPPFMVTPGLADLALHRPVTSNEDPFTGDLDQLTDGLKKSGEFDYVEGPAWVQIDLGRPSRIHAVVLWHFYRNPVIYNDVIVRSADDAGFTENVRTLFNNDHDNSSGLGRGGDAAYISRWWGEIVDARGADNAGTTARYIRLYTAGGVEGELSRYVEIAVYGK